MTGVDRIISRIMGDAEEKAKVILEAADAECERIKNEYNEKAEKECAACAEECARRGSEMINTARAQASYEKNLKLASAMFRSVHSVFESAKYEIMYFPHEKYLELLVSMLSKAMIAHKEHIEALGGKYESESESYLVYLNERDRAAYGEALMDGLRRRVVGRVDSKLTEKVRVADEALDIDGGLILRCGRIDYDLSLEALIGELRGECESCVRDILFKLEGEQNS